ncbi:phage tail protein [Corynebacterium diphtheriae]|nr:phage tail protein [Corynebacterium diphtheriae]CAB0929311.1 phage tail protein [Corynebacterium diphtheriae]CAB0977212.1 phage tail protein [Corynebacterium diphtheriae]
MANYSAGSASVTIKPDLSKFAEKLRAEIQRINQDYSVDITPDMSAFAARLKAELDAQAHTTTIDVDANTTQAETKITEAAQNKTATINIDADTLDAKTKITEATHDRRTTVNVDADTTKARTKISETSRTRRTRILVNVDLGAAATRLATLTRTRVVTLIARLNTTTAQAKLTALRAQIMALHAAGLKLGIISAAIGGIGTLAAGAIGPLSAMVALLVQASSVAAVLPAAIAGMGAGLGALIVGVGGVGKAFGAMGQQASGAGSSAADSMEKAQRAVESAERAIVDANRGIRDSERNLAQAQERSRQAQKDLTNARKEAKEELKDLNERLREAALNEEDATLGVARAYQRLQETKSSSKSSELDIAEADLAYRKSISTLQRVKDENDKLTESTAKANAQGVEGSEKVVNAKKEVEDAQYNELKAAEQLEDANYRLVEANRQLADALSAVGDAASGAAGGMDPFAEALAALSPNAREFVLAMRDLGDQWNDLKLATQDRLFEGLGAAVTTLANVQLPVLKTGLSNIAGEINTGLRNAIAEFSKETAAIDFSTTLNNARGMFAQLAEAAKPLSNIWIDFATVGSAYLPRLGAAINETLGGWSTKVDQMRQDGSLAENIEKGIQAFKRLGHGIQTTWSLLSGFFGAAAQAGVPFLGMMGAAVEKMDAWVNSAEGQETLVNMFTSASNAINALMPVFGAIGTTFATQVIPFFEKLAVAAGPGLTNAFQTLGDVWQTLQPVAPILGASIGMLTTAFAHILEAIAPIIAFLAPVLIPALAAIAPVIAVVLGPIGSFVGMLLKVTSVLKHAKTAFTVLRTAMTLLTGPIGIIIGVGTLLVLAFVNLYKNNEAFRNAVNKLGAYLKAGFMSAVDGAKTFVIRLAGAFLHAKTKVVEWWNSTKQRFSNFHEAIKQMPTKVKEVFNNAKEWLKNAGRNIINGLQEGMKQAWASVSNWFDDKINRLRHPFSGGSGRRQAYGGYTTYADGGITAYADGGVPRKSKQEAQIARGGEWVVWAEDETQGESFIPHAPSKRGRATQILVQTADIFGYDVVDRTGQRVQRDGTNISPRPAQRIHAYADGGITVEDMDNFARGLEGKPYVWGGVNWGDCSGSMSAISRYAAGLDPFGGRFATGNEGDALRAMGFSNGKGGPGALTIGWFNGGPWGGHTAGTLPSGTNVEMGGGRGNGQFGGPAAGANDPQFTDHAHLPAEMFKPIKVPKIGGLEFGRGDSSEDLVNFRESEASDPRSYGAEDGTGESSPTTLGELGSSWLKSMSKIGLEALTGWVDDAANALVGQAELPPVFKAWQMFEKARIKAKKQTNPAQAANRISEVEQESARFLRENPSVDTETVAGGSLVDLQPVATNTRGGDVIHHVWDPAGGAEQWRPMAAQAIAHVGLNNSQPQVDAMVKQIQSESGGNPNIAQQIVDVNGTGDAAGVGLLQIIPSTFAAHRDPTLPNDRRDPWANMNAALRYFKSRYGLDLTEVWGKGHGYANGGSVWGKGGSRQDLIPAVLSNGEFVNNAASAQAARPLLTAMNSDPGFAASLNKAFTNTTNNASHHAGDVKINYTIQASNADEGLRLAEMHAKQQVFSMSGAR